MGKKEKQAYLEAIRLRYQKAKRAAKGNILDEFCAVCGYHRKSALRVLNRKPCKRRPAVKTGRRSRYDDPAVQRPLKAIWLATDQIASKRLKQALPLWLPHYEDVHGKLTASVRERLLTMSASTIDRLLAPVRAHSERRGLSGTKPGTLLKQQIPLQLGVWDVSLPGFMEADTVAHGGSSLAGDFVWSLTLTDLYSGWTECRAVWNKGSRGILTQIKAIQAVLPFAVRGFDCDNGSEFLNWHLLRYFQNAKDPVQFTRSRPYHKNDNAHVEQKNWSCVRQLLGYDRLAHPHLVQPINDLYANEFSLLTNYFLPTMKLKEKKRIGAKIIKKHAVPQTPVQRLLDHPQISNTQKKHLENQQKALNPFVLQATIQKKLRKIFKGVR